MKKTKRFLGTFWPIIAVLPLTYAISIVVSLAGDPWKPGDWGSNVVLALVITIATVILSQKQARLQENAADLELDEKIAVLSGAIDLLRIERTPSRACQIINDGKAGLNLIGSGHEEARVEYLENLRRALVAIEDLISTDLYCQTYWSASDWQVVNHTLGGMLAPLRRRKSRRKNLDKNGIYELEVAVKQLEERTGGDEIPFSVFGSHYRDRDMRVLFAWDELSERARLDETVRIGPRRVRIDRIAYTRIREIPLNDCFTPWFGTKEKRITRFDDPQASPILLDQVHQWMDSFSDVRRDRIASILDSMDHATSDNPYKFAIATLRLDSGSLIVLDGNHRLAAAAISKVRRGGVAQNVEVVEFRVCTMINDDLLPDLNWHLRQAIKSVDRSDDPPAPTAESA